MALLYPPLLRVQQVPFVYTDEKIHIYFAISEYNSFSDVESMEISVKYQSSNKNATKDDSGFLKVTVFGTDARVEDDYQYWVELATSALKEEAWTPQMIYKVQMRFVNSAGTKSEWSTVTLLRPIYQPVLNILGNASQTTEIDVVDEDDPTLEEYSTTLLTSDAEFLAVYRPQGSGEALKSWRMRLYDYENLLLGDSGMITRHTVSSDALATDFKYTFMYQLKDGEKYTLYAQVETINGYQINNKFTFNVVTGAIAGFLGDVTVVPNNEEGYMEIHAKYDTPIFQSLILRRTDSRTHFTLWQDVCYKKYDGVAIDWVYRDYTIESGVFYKYGVQVRTALGRSKTKYARDGQAIQVCDFEHAYLLGPDGQQLKLKYDLNVSSIGITTNQSQVTTLGSRFPYIDKTGENYFFTAQISATVSLSMDDNENFVNNKVLHYHQVDMYKNHWDKYRDEYGWGQQWNVTDEYRFRDMVTEFLYNNKPKYFKSAQDGNFLCKLMDVSENPNNQLGRNVYSFSASLVQIATGDLDSLEEYGIINRGSSTIPAEIQEYYSDIIGQVNSTDLGKFSSSYSITQAIVNKYFLNVEVNKATVKSIDLLWLRLDFDDPGYKVVQSGSSYSVITIPSSEYEARKNDKDVGHLFYYDSKPYFVPAASGVYEFKNDNLLIPLTRGAGIQIYPYRAENMTVTFCARLYTYVTSASTVTGSDRTPKSITYLREIGSLFYDTVPLGYDFIVGIYRKYATETEDYYMQVKQITDLSIYADPGTVLVLQTEDNSTPQSFVIDETGNLTFGNDSGQNFLQGYFIGKYMSEEELATYPTREVGDNLQVKYHGEWYEVTKAYDGSGYWVPIPLNMPIIVYTVQIVKGSYV